MTHFTPRCGGANRTMRLEGEGHDAALAAEPDRVTEPRERNRPRPPRAPRSSRSGRIDQARKSKDVMFKDLEAPRNEPPTVFWISA
jgi:hypothetical protein